MDVQESILTDEQNEAIAQLVAITGSSNEQAKQALEACDWNLEMAVNLQMDIGHSAPSVESPAGEAVPSDLLRNAITEEVRAPIPPVRQVLVDDHFDMSSLPHRSTRSTSHPIFGVRNPGVGLRDFQAEARWREQSMAEADDPEVAEVNAAKIQTLEDLFRPPLDLIFLGNMDAAKQEGCTKNKWLMINVQNTEEFACQVLNRDVWSNSGVKSLIKEHFIFWQVYHQTRDGQRYMQFYPFTTFPYIAVLDPRTGEVLITWNNIQDPDMFCEKVTDFLTYHPSPSGEVTGEESNSTSIFNHVSASVVNNNHDESTSGSSNSARIITEMTEEQQMEAAIAASLETVKKEAERQEEDDDEDGEIETFESSEDEADTGFEGSQNSRTTTGSKTEKEDFSKFLGTDSSLAELVFRFPDGQRERFTFPQDSKVKAVFLWVASKGFDLQEYDLVTNFPRRNIHDLNPEDTLSSVGLMKDQIFIQLKS